MQFYLIETRHTATSEFIHGEGGGGGYDCDDNIARRHHQGE